MKQGWEKVYLSDISVNLDSKRVPIKKGARTGGIYPYYGASGIVDYVSDYIFDDDLLLISEDGANLLARSTPIAFSVSGKIWVNNHAHILKFEGKITQRYVERYFENIKIDDFVTGAAQPKLNQKALCSIPISIPKDITEQERIVGFLDIAFAKIEALRANAEQNLKNAKDLFQASLKQELTFKTNWVHSTLKDECHKITDGTHQTPTYYESGVLFLSSKNVTSGKINWDDVKYIDEIQHKEMHKRVAPKINDILLAKNGTTGVAAIVDREVIFDIYVSLALLRTVGNIIPEFLLHYVNSPLAKKQFNKRLKGSGVPNLHLEEIRQVKISYPKSIKEQQSIVKKLDALSERCRAMEENYRLTLTACEKLKQALLKKAFNGEL